ncbi:MAG TPA: helix-turn-helix domain-containing protein [Candidatus Acidoferrum sp.]|jgi:DNA-binding HxlR family transcriptional regulator|nr:helix-turn-helix domain-containing protein [Candidatus Acidoferrum sp.]
MNQKSILPNELRKLVETRLKDNINGIEATLQQVFQTQPLELEDLKETMNALEQSFNMLSQKWNLQILYTLFLRKTAGFGELKKILGVNSRTLSDKLKILKKGGYIQRAVEQEPLLRVRYSLTTKGNNTILLALPFLYYSSGNLA